MSAARPPSRPEIEAAPRRVLKQGERDKADLFVVDLGGVPTVIKDFRPKAWWVRLIGRVQIAREVGAYRRLAEISGIPRFVGRIDAHAVALEWIDGQALADASDRAENGPEKLAQLRGILDRIHAAGVVHWDLRARENLLIDRAGRLFVIDFASAVHLRPGGLLHRWLFDRLRLIDESAYLKWKGMLDAGRYTAEEQEFLERFRFWRSLWFHRRQAWRGKTGPPP